MWYIDNKNSSHVDWKVIDNLLEIIINFEEIIITRGKKHTFLGMNIQITEENKIDIEMKDQLMETIRLLGRSLMEK